MCEPSPGSLSRVRYNDARAEPPWGLSPHASASVSTTVDFPDPFSPTRTVSPGGSSSPSRRICAMAGTVAGQADASTGLPGSSRIKRIMRSSMLALNRRCPPYRHLAPPYRHNGGSMGSDDEQGNRGILARGGGADVAVEDLVVTEHRWA